MAKETSQTQNDGFFASMFEKNFNRFNSMIDEMAKVEEKAFSQSHKNVDDASKMVKASIDYTADLHEQWREMMVDSTKKTMQMMTWNA